MPCLIPASGPDVGCGGSPRGKPPPRECTRVLLGEGARGAREEVWWTRSRVLWCAGGWSRALLGCGPGLDLGAGNPCSSPPKSSPTGRPRPRCWFRAAARLLSMAWFSMEADCSPASLGGT